MKYYKAEIYFTRITEVEVTKETDKCVYILNSRGIEQRYAMTGKYDCYFKDFESAKNHMLKLCEVEIKRREGNLNHEKSKLEKILKL